MRDDPIKRPGLRFSLAGGANEGARADGVAGDGLAVAAALLLAVPGSVVDADGWSGVWPDAAPLEG